VTQFTISCAVELLSLVTGDFIVEKSYQNYRRQTAVESVWSVSKLSTESVGSRRELVANSVHTADATQLDSCVASAVCIVWKAVLDVSCRRQRVE